MAPPVKEYKEFFLRAVQIAGGSKPDKQPNYPTEYIITTPNGIRVVKNRFLKTHFPNEDVFHKFMESITFKLNPEDTATTEIQGLVRIAVGDAIINRISKDTTVENGTNHEYTTVVIPSTLPIVSAGSGITVTPQIRRVSDNVIVGSITPGDRALYYLDYLIESSVLAVDNVKTPSYLEIDTATIEEGSLLPNGGGCSLLFVTIPANTLKTAADHIEIDMTILKLVEGGGTKPKEMQFITGSSLSDSFGLIFGPTLDSGVGDAKCFAHVQLKIFRKTNTIGLVIGTIRYFAPLNSETAIGSNSYDKATKFFSKILTDVDWDNLNFNISLYYDEPPANVNEATALKLVQILKTIVNQ